jgi:DNA-binding protein YbaB
MVKVRVNGKQEVVSCTLSDEVFRCNDREMLEDLIQAATNQALDRARLQLAEETSKAATEFGLPSGMSLPGTTGE